MKIAHLLTQAVVLDSLQSSFTRMAFHSEKVDEINTQKTTEEKNGEPDKRIRDGETLTYN